MESISLNGVSYSVISDTQLGDCGWKVSIPPGREGGATKGVVRNCLPAEIDILMMLQSDVILQAYEIEEPLVLFENYEETGTDYTNRLQSSGSIPNRSEVMKLLKGVCKGVGLLHSMSTPITHSMIGFDSIVRCSDNNWKVTGLGYCRNVAWKSYNDEHAEMIKSRCTTPLMSAPPELLDFSHHMLVNNQQDVWAIGMIMYYLLCGLRYPFSTPDEIINAALYIPKGTQDNDISILNKCLAKEPYNRLNIWQLAEMLQIEGMPEKVADWEEQQLASWCVQNVKPEATSPLQVQFDCAVASPGPMLDLSSMDGPLRTHKVFSFRDNSKPVTRTWFARVKDFTEKSIGLSSSTLKHFHSNTPHSWMIRCTDSTYDAIPTLYLTKLVEWAKHIDNISAFFHYIKLRPIKYDSVVAYRCLCLIHKVLQDCPIDCMKLIYTQQQSFFSDLELRWTGTTHSKLPVLPSVVVHYCRFLDKRLYCVLANGSLTGKTEEELATVGAVFIQGVELASRVCPPHEGKAFLLNNSLHSLIVDLSTSHSLLSTTSHVNSPHWKPILSGYQNAASLFGVLVKKLKKSNPELLAICKTSPRSSKPTAKAAKVVEKPPPQQNLSSKPLQSLPSASSVPSSDMFPTVEASDLVSVSPPRDPKQHRHTDPSSHRATSPIPPPENSTTSNVGDLLLFS
eukprot:TRINITY_DN2219_c0_g2_i1.p1 TRINITY_DN2219_c0_g2~~TRINITY_DN2219_c0_g2_i1.p1  ORF type:complete len:679 (+),score=90.66 TRINITY_DN2219_c0_g2_i1:37-2073(+)